MQELVGVFGEPERLLGVGSGGDPVADAELELAEGAQRERQVADETSVARERDRALELATRGVVVLHPAGEQAQASRPGTAVRRSPRRVSRARRGAAAADSRGRPPRRAMSIHPSVDSAAAADEPPSGPASATAASAVATAAVTSPRLALANAAPHSITAARAGSRSRIRAAPASSTSSGLLDAALRDQELALQDLGVRAQVRGASAVEDLVELDQRLGRPPRLREIARPLQPQPQRLIGVGRRLDRPPPRLGRRARRAARASRPRDAGQRGGDVRVRPVAGLGEVPGRALGLAGLAPGPRERLVSQPALRRRGDLERGGLRERVREPRRAGLQMRQPTVDGGLDRAPGDPEIGQRPFHHRRRRLLVGAQHHERIAGLR